MLRGIFSYYIKIVILSILCIFATISSFAQTNEKTKDKEIKQVKEIDKDPTRPGLKEKRDSYLTQTRKQRLSTGKQTDKKIDPKNNKQNEAAATSSGDLPGKTKGQKETEYINRTGQQRTFKGKSEVPDNNVKSLARDIDKNATNIKAGSPSSREYDQVSRTRDQRGFSGGTKIPSNAQREETKKNIDGYSGDQKYQTRGEKENQYAKSTSDQRAYTGSNKIPSNEIKEENKKMINNYSGDQKYMTQGQKEALYLKKTQGVREYQGNAKVSDLEYLQRKEQNKADMQKYASGDISMNDLAKRQKQIQKKDKQIGEFQGNMRLERNEIREQVKKDMGAYSGDVALTDLAKREKMRRQKSKEMASFAGSVRTKDLQKLGKSIRKKEKDIANFQGNIKLAKRKKGAHPSAAYRGGKVANSYTQKEKMRKKMLKKYGRKGDIDMPQNLKDQPKKAKYNADESEIWW